MFGRVIAHIRNINRRNSVAAHFVVQCSVLQLPLYVRFSPSAGPRWGKEQALSDAILNFWL